MGAQYEPGTVARVTFTPATGDRKGVARNALRWQYGWLVVYSDGTYEAIHDLRITDVRLSVVLDLEALCRQGGFFAHLGENGAAGALRSLLKTPETPGGQLLCRLLAEEIAAQTDPPKPDEPAGLGAVVKDRAGTRWVRIYGQPTGPTREQWECDNSQPMHEDRSYDAIDVVEVLSEGVFP